MSAWKTVTLGDVAGFIRGINFKPDDVQTIDTPGVVACMRTKNVQTELDLTDVWGVAEHFVRRDEQFLLAGDILVSSANSWNLVGKCSWIPELPWRASFGGFVCVLRADRAQIDPRYLFRWFASGRIQALARSFGQKTTNISNLNIDRCLKLEFSMPPLADQRRIAKVLDQADALRAKRHAALAQLDSLTHSIFLDMFGNPVANPKGWPSKQLQDVLSIPLRNGISPSKTGTFKAKVLTLSAITGSQFNSAAWKLAPFRERPRSSQAVDELDFLICRGNGNIHLVGKGHFPSNPMVDVTFPDTMIAARLARDLVGRAFLQHIWNAESVRRQIEALARTTNGTFKVNQTMLEGITFFSPPIASQKIFAHRVTAIEALKTTHRAALAELDALFASLQHRAFRGEL